MEKHLQNIYVLVIQSGYNTILLEKLFKKNCRFFTVERTSPKRHDSDSNECSVALFLVARTYTKHVLLGL